MKADTITKDFLSDTTVFADVFNYYIYNGEQVILPQHLTERDTTEIAIPYGADGAAVPIQKFRDVQNLCTIKTDGILDYILLGTESQADIQYAMPVKNNLYDAIDYAAQVEQAAKSHRRAIKDAKNAPKPNNVKQTNESSIKPNSGEFLSGFWKTDKLIPSLTVTIYFGVDEWDAPLSLFDMLDIKDARILSCLDNYHVHLIAPAHMTDNEIMKFQSNLREVLLFIKYSKDKNKLNKILEQNQARFREVERRAVDVIEAITHLGLDYNESEDVIDMCQAIKEMREESLQEGLLRGRREGEIEGRQAGLIEGRRQGELEGHQAGLIEGKIETAKNLYHLGIDIDKIAEGVGFNIETVRSWLGLTPKNQL